MASLSDAAFKTDATRVGEKNCFRRFLPQKLLRSEDRFVKHRVVGRYYVAAMLFIVNALHIWRTVNVEHSLDYAYLGTHFLSPVVQYWTSAEYFRTFTYSELYVQICIQVPAALLIYLTSSYKFLTATVAISSVLHMLIPVAHNIHSSLQLIMIYAHLLVQAPLRIAVLSMWKDWAPPGERTKFVFLSFFSFILARPLSMMFSGSTLRTEESFYIAGACGLGWSFLWFFTVTDTPGINPESPNYDQLCVQNNTLLAVKERPKLSAVPWKRILTSKPVFALCLIYYKFGSSFLVIWSEIFDFGYKLKFADYLQDLHFWIIFAVLYAAFSLSSAIATDFLIRKYPRMINVRKRIIFGVLIFHGILLLGTLFHDLIPQVIFTCLSYFTFSVCLAGFLTNALDLSSQYVPIIGGFIEIFYSLGSLLSQYYILSMDTYMEEQEITNKVGKILLYEVAVSIFVAVIFLFWGSFEEQPWSVNTASIRGSANTEVREMPDEHELKSVKEDS